MRFEDVPVLGELVLFRIGTVFGPVVLPNGREELVDEGRSGFFMSVSV